MIHLTPAAAGYTVVTICHGGEQYVVMTDEPKTVGADLHIADGIRLKELIHADRGIAGTQFARPSSLG